MPRFNDNEYGNEKRKLNDEIDRTVPDNENYYKSYDELSSDASVRDNQDGYVDITSILNDFSNSRNQNDEPIRHSNQRSNNRPPQRSSNKKQNKKKRFSKGKIALTSIIAIILAIVLFVSGSINSVLNKIIYDEKIENKYVSSDELKDDKDVINVLLLGVDARLKKGEDAKHSRSDSMMIVSIDKKHKCIKTISFLRDSWVYIPCHEGRQRLNTACQYGSYNGVADTIEYNFGIDVDGYVVVNFSVFESLVDAIGGVEMEVTAEEAKEVTSHKKRYGNVVLEEGKYKLTGKQALAYCRIRKIDTDFMRAYRQRMVIKSIINGIKAQPTKLPTIAKNCAEYIETDFTKGELKKIAVSAMSCLKADMVETRVPFDGTWNYANIYGASVIELDTEKNKEMLINYIYEKSAEEIIEEENTKENK